jgi:hypothetical protein
LILTVVKDFDPPVLDDIRSILTRLRPRDACELAEYGLAREAAALGLASEAVAARIFACDGLPAAIVAFHQLTPKTLVVSLMATDAWPRVARAVLLWGVRGARPQLIARGFERAECRTMEGHTEAIELLERLGFVHECRLPRFGAHGASFLQYAWRLIDHGPVQSPESAPAAAPAADARLETGGRAA